MERELLMKLYTIGYAHLNSKDLIHLLKKYNVTKVVDVRSMPYSKTFPNFSANNLKEQLNKSDIGYILMRTSFGARRKESEVYTKGFYYNNNPITYVDYGKVWNTKSFQDGFSKTMKELSDLQVICLLCSEKLPQNCHRAIMIGEYFYLKKVEVIHIVDNDREMSHREVHEVIEKELEEFKSWYYKKHPIQENLLGQVLFTEAENHWISIFDFAKKEGISKAAIIYKNIGIGFTGDIDDA